MNGGMRRWPLYLIAAPAAVVVWTGWVGLGTLCGFQTFHPLGITLNTALTLPVGVEAYGAYALGAWLRSGRRGAANLAVRSFARASAIGSLALGMLGQVVYHLLAAAHATRAPWPVVVLVSCLPVVTLGFAFALSHLLQAAADAAPAAAGTAVPERAPRPAPGTAPRVRPPLPAPAPARTREVPAPVTDAAAEVHFAADLAAGELPSVRRIKAELHVGQDRAQAIRAHLSGVAAGPPGGPALYAVRDGGPR